MSARSRLARLHACLAFLALAFLAAFWLSSLIAESLLPDAGVATVKQGIAYALLGFVPVMAMTGASGFALGGKGQHALLRGKRARMRIIGANGLLVLVPTALWLSWRAQAGALDGIFYTVQAVEFVAGAVNIALIGLNIRDGLRLKRLKAGARI